jgi:hypothetical protein
VPITATYHVRCDTCWGALAPDYDTHAAALAARKKLGWDDGDGKTACPAHKTTEKEN